MEHSAITTTFFLAFFESYLPDRTLTTDRAQSPISAGNANVAGGPIRSPVLRCPLQGAPSVARPSQTSSPYSPNQLSFHTPLSVFWSSSWPFVRGNLVFYLTDPSKSNQKSSHDCPPQFSGDPISAAHPLCCALGGWALLPFLPLGSHSLGQSPKQALH